MSAIDVEERVRSAVRRLNDALELAHDAGRRSSVTVSYSPTHKEATSASVQMRDPNVWTDGHVTATGVR